MSADVVIEGLAGGGFDHRAEEDVAGIAVGADPARLSREFHVRGEPLLDQGGLADRRLPSPWIQPSRCRGARSFTPEVCARSCRMVTSAGAPDFATVLNSGRYLVSGSSSRTLPTSTSCMIAVAVKSLVTDQKW